MAWDWIKVRESIHEDPAVLRIAANLGTRPEHIVGYLVKFWSWVSRNCHAGSVTGVTLVSLECVLNLPGFCDELVKVGWLEVEESDGETRINIPKYDRHLSQGAKARALASERQRSSRASRHASVTDVSQVCHTKTMTREEKRREEYTHTHTHGVESSFVSDSQKAEAIDRWCRYRLTQFGDLPGSEVVEAIQRQYAGWDAAKFSTAVDFSIAKQAKSILDPEIDFQKQSPARAKNGRPAKNYTMPHFVAPEGSS